MLYMCNARCYPPISPPNTHTHTLYLSHTHAKIYLHSASPPGLSVQSRLLTKGKKKKQQKAAELGPENQTRAHVPVSMTNCTLEGESGDEKLRSIWNRYRKKLCELITAVAPGVVYEKYQLSLKEMKYKTLLMNLNGLPFPLKGMDDKVWRKMGDSIKPCDKFSRLLYPC